MALVMGPIEYLDACTEAPREMAIFRAVQDAMRAAQGRRMKEQEAARGRDR